MTRALRRSQALDELIIHRKRGDGSDSLTLARYIAIHRPGSTGTPDPALTFKYNRIKESGGMDDLFN